MVAKMKALIPNLMVKNVRETVDFYVSVLGFKISMAVSENEDILTGEIPEDVSLIYANINNWEVEIMFQEENSFKNDITTLESVQIGSSSTLFIELEDIEWYYEYINEKIEIVKDLQTTWYWMKEFYIRDINWYILCFAEKI